MTDLAVRVENLGKRYQIRAGRRAGPTMLREGLAAAVAAPFRRLALLAPWAQRRVVSDPAVAVEPGPDHIWALRNVSFEVPRGQILGIIGPNGAGKSTLLKVLSRITEPTEGRAEIHGRVGSLLEVGTGFHPELTGRENIYLSGALLGMRKLEIDRKLDEIVAFAEIARFVETPVKHYSSGMYVRLGFAVAAHFEPAILIIDEVLAVGDVGFQRKCLSKMEDVRQHGRTILFVSHNMPAVTRICERALLISGGAIQKDGASGDVASAYLLSALGTEAERTWPDPLNAPGDHVTRLRALRVCDETGVSRKTTDIRQATAIEMIYEVLEAGHVLWPYLFFYNESGVCVFGSLDLDHEWRGRQRPRGRYVTNVKIPGNLLAEGVLLVGAGVCSYQPFQIHFYAADAVAFHVVDAHDGDSARGDWQGDFPGALRPLLTWTNKVERYEDGMRPSTSPP